MARLSHVVLFVLSRGLLLSLAQGENRFYQRCAPFYCGSLGYLGFPFTTRTRPYGCGLLMVDNCDEAVPKIQLVNNGRWFYITSISQDNTITLGDSPEFGKPLNKCSSVTFQNWTSPIFPFMSFQMPSNQVLVKCFGKNFTLPNFKFLCRDSKYSIFDSNYPNHDFSLPPQCSCIPFQVNKTEKYVNIINLYTGSFRLTVNVTDECLECHRKGGKCQSDSKGKFHCSGGRTDGELGFKLGLGITGTGIGMLVIISFCFRKKLLTDNSMVFWKKKTENYQNIELFLKNHGSLAPKRYSYLDIKKMTNSFKHKLGQGGFGDVYKGSLLDGRNVAVKVLKEAKSNGEEFINEVASISRTSHVNIVTLLGFCFEGSKRALIYEFVPNGSLEKFVCEKNPLETAHKLKWGTLYQIAVGIARGLEYLHRGCSTRILHFDIKPHNILLDEDFCPKISDFGLAKICPGKESIVSMTNARGTIGYVAPEVFYRSIGGVSPKSDVYSYGMMVLEMAGGRNNKNIDVGVNHSSDIYFPDWIYKRLELHKDIGLQGIENEEDSECARKMIIVSLWCIQTNPSDRPPMSRVVDMLEGSLGSLQTPPKPCLSSSTSYPRASTSVHTETVSL